MRRLNAGRTAYPVGVLPYFVCYYMCSATYSTYYSNYLVSQGVSTGDIGSIMALSPIIALRRTMLAYARCNEGDEYLAVCRYGRTPEGIRMGRMVYEMSDDLWDVYQRCIERQA